MNINKINALCDQVINVALVVKETTNDINNSEHLKDYPFDFIKRINSILRCCYNMFVNANNSYYTEYEINDQMINLMNTIVTYKNSYYEKTYSYKTMNSLLDITKESFIEFNK